MHRNLQTPVEAKDRGVNAKSKQDAFDDLPVPSEAGPIGAVVWALVGPVGDDHLSVIAADAAEAIDVFLACDDGEYCAAGGLRVVEGDVVIDPGCCNGLDEWRDWVGAVKGHTVGFGHDPDVWVEPRGPLVRVWEDESEFTMDDVPGPNARHIDFARDDLPALLLGVQRDLSDFLRTLHRWALDVVPAQADRLTDAVDRRLEISRRLDL